MSLQLSIDDPEGRQKLRAMIADGEIPRDPVRPGLVGTIVCAILDINAAQLDKIRPAAFAAIGAGGLPVGFAGPPGSETGADDSFPFAPIPNQPDGAIALSLPGGLVLGFSDPLGSANPKLVAGGDPKPPPDPQGIVKQIQDRFPLDPNQFWVDALVAQRVLTFAEGLWLKGQQ